MAAHLRMSFMIIFVIVPGNIMLQHQMYRYFDAATKHSLQVQTHWRLGKPAVP